MAPLADIPLARETLDALGDGDYDAEVFFTEYGNRIEAQAERVDGSPITPHAREEMIALLNYFEHEPSSNYQQWPQVGLRLFAMLSPIGVASSILGPNPETLELAIRSVRPNKPWQWWHLLGKLILDSFSEEYIAEALGLSIRAVRGYVIALVGPWRRAA